MVQLNVPSTPITTLYQAAPTARKHRFDLTRVGALSTFTGLLFFASGFYSFMKFLGIEGFDGIGGAGDMEVVGICFVTYTSIF